MYKGRNTSLKGQSLEFSCLQNMYNSFLLYLIIQQFLPQIFFHFGEGYVTC